MLTDVTWLTPLEAADLIWAAKPQHMSRDDFVANWERIRPVRTDRVGVYVGLDLQVWLSADFCPSHDLVNPYPGDPTYGATLEEVPTRVGQMQREIREGTWRSPYGTADDVEQALAYLDRFISDPDRRYVLETHRLDKEHDGDFRFHKNGPYIGERFNLDEDGEGWMPEHLRDCDRMDGVLRFHIYEVVAVESGGAA